jgi:hypothetical protein
MFEAQLLIAKGDGNDYSVFSPWMPRGGDNLTATLEVIERDSATLTVRVFTKNSEDVGAGSDADVSKTISGGAAGRSDETWSGVLKELVRYKFTVSSETAGQWILFRMLSPVWFDDVKA